MSDGAPIGKILAGCGCLMIVVLAIAGVAGFFLYRTGSEVAKEMKEELPIDGVPLPVPGANDGDGSGKSGSAGKSDGTAKPSKDKENLTPAKVRAALKKPLTQKDVDRVFGVYEGLRKTDAYDQWHESLDGLKKAGNNKDKGTLETMKAMRDSMKGFDAYRDLFEEYERLVKKSGGYDAYLASLVRMSGAAAAAKQIARDHKKKEPSTTEVAKLILEDRPEIKKEFDKTVAEAKKIAKKDATKQREGSVSMMMLLQQPGTIAIGRMPKKSFDNWKSFPAKQRKEIIELPKTAPQEFPGMLIGITWSGEPLIVSSELETFKELTGK